MRLDTECICSVSRGAIAATYFSRDSDTYCINQVVHVGGIISPRRCNQVEVALHAAMHADGIACCLRCLTNARQQALAHGANSGPKLSSRTPYGVEISTHYGFTVTSARCAAVSLALNTTPLPPVLPCHSPALP